MGRTERNVRKIEGQIEKLTLAEIIDSVTDEEMKGNSYIFNQLMTVDAPEPAWVKFASTVGRWEIGIGDVFRHNQRRINMALQLLSIMMNAQDEIKLIEIYKKLKQNREQIPSIVRSVVGGMIGGQLQAQYNPPVQVVPTQTTDWTSYEVAPNLPSPVNYGPVSLISGKAYLSPPGNDAIGVAVSVAGTVAEVATNGQKIKNIPADKMQDLSPGDMLFAVPAPIKNRNLITMAEAQTVFAIGNPIKPIARVLRNDSEQHTIVIEDLPIRLIPAP